MSVALGILVALLFPLGIVGGLGTQASAESGPPDPPGGALATALVFLIAWAYYLATFVRHVRRPATQAPIMPSPAPPPVRA